MRYRLYYLLSYLLFGLFIQTTTSCNKHSGLSKANITFSVDTVLFDTVFTTLGSSTQQFKIYNPDPKTILLQEVELMGGKNSPFRLNLDGVSGIRFSDLSIEGGDSLFAFIDVTLNVSGKNYPVVIEDSVRIRTNNRNQYLKLVVWGQDAYFHRKEIISESVWKNDKPHVIYNYAAVDSAKTLTIEAGTKIYMHKDAILYVYKGELNIDGTKDKKVEIQGDRLESFYEDVSGQYYGIYFQEAKSSTINHAHIFNGTAGIHVYSKDKNNTKPTVTITNSILENNARYGVFLFDNPSIKMENCIVSKNEVYGLFVLQGAELDITHCNILGYGKSSQNASALALKNYYTDNETKNTFVSSITGNINNSVIYGYRDDELLFDTISLAGVDLKLSFNSNLIRSSIIPKNPLYTNNIWNVDPEFVNVSDDNFLFFLNSPLNNSANPTLSLPLDILERNRSALTPDIGAYEVD